MMMMTGMMVLFVLLVGLVLSGIFFRYMDTTAGISFSSLKFADLRMEGTRYWTIAVGTGFNSLKRQLNLST
ncbi:hypothetical protein [Lactiplantibacillus plantarum]|uniref:hypothetical protein n=1 Tax=Lactiplantibacillus plantarum TaxID=1590 RepID=UPI0020139FB2|nr:hypothetical protein [Lactiplantibacillus plantarum]